jgi:aspartate racemase
MMVSSGQALTRAGAEFIIIPCVSAHYFLPELRRKITLPILSMLDETALQIAASRPAIKTIGLLAAEGTMKVRLFQKRLSLAGIQTIIPDGTDREEVQNYIFKIKDTRSGNDRKEISQGFVEIGERMMARGAEAILIGCTEISIVVEPDSFAVRGFDALTILAKAAIREAGIMMVS